MNRSGKIHALLSTARVANVPSVVSNVWLGVAIGMLRSGTTEVPWQDAANVAISGVSLYLAGNFFNDWMDRKWDVTHRPERALPRGLFPPLLYLALALGLGGLGVLLAGQTSLPLGWVALLIVFCIVIYTVFHKRTTWAVIPMGLCRALLPIMGFTLFFPFIDGVWPAAAGIFCYIMGLSLSARYESMPEPPKRIAVMARGLLLGTVVLVAWGNRGLLVDKVPSILGALPYLTWTSLCLKLWRKPVPRLVSRLLAGIPLVDWMLLLPVFLSLAAAGDGWSGFAIACFTIPPLAFISALLLQRLAPAT
jgi:hypothetical protein